MINPKPAAESPLFTRFYDLMHWLVQRVEKFPRSQRFILGSRVLDTAFGCHALLVSARKMTGTARQEALLQADIQLETIRLQLRLAHDLRCLTIEQYEYGSRLLLEVGKLLGAWRKG